MTNVVIITDSFDSKYKVDTISNDKIEYKTFNNIDFAIESFINTNIGESTDIIVLDTKRDAINFLSVCYHKGINYKKYKLVTTIDNTFYKLKPNRLRMFIELEEGELESLSPI